jgi:hypothetical protein
MPCQSVPPDGGRRAERRLAAARRVRRQGDAGWPPAATARAGQGRAPTGQGRAGEEEAVCRLCPGWLLAWACHPRTMGGCSVVGHTPHCHDLTWSLSLAVKIPRTSPRFVTTPQYSRGSPNPTPALPFHLSFTSGQWGCGGGCLEYSHPLVNLLLVAVCVVRA